MSTTIEFTLYLTIFLLEVVYLEIFIFQDLYSGEIILPVTLQISNFSPLQTISTMRILKVFYFILKVAQNN